MAYSIGMGGSVKYAVGIGDPATVVCVDQWSMEWRNDLQDVTTTCSGGCIDRIAGVSDATLTFSGFYDDNAPIYADLEPGILVTFESDIDSTGHNLTGLFYVQSINLENPAKAPVKFTVVAQSTGCVQYNGSSV